MYCKTLNHVSWSNKFIFVLLFNLFHTLTEITFFSLFFGMAQSEPTKWEYFNINVNLCLSLTFFRLRWFMQTLTVPLETSSTGRI